MDFCPSLVVGINSITSVKVTSGTATGNLQFSGFDVPLTANSLKEAAPS